MSEDCHQCAARISRQSDYWWWLRTAAMRAGRAAEEQRSLDMLVPIDFAHALGGALFWPGTIHVTLGATEHTDMRRLVFEWRMSNSE